MIDLYFRPTANGHKITIFLEESGLAHRIIRIEDVEGGHLGPSFLPISPNGKIPAIVDHAPEDGGAPIPVFESGAILIYLAEKTGRFLPTVRRERIEAIQWVMWQMAGLGPMAGQAGHFRHQAPPSTDSYAADRYTREVGRLYAVLDHRLARRDFIAGDYGIADMACHPWVSATDIVGLSLDEFPNLRAWWARVNARPAVQRAYGGAAGYVPSARLDEAAHVRRYRQTAQMMRDAFSRMDAAQPPA